MISYVCRDVMNTIIIIFGIAAIQSAAVYAAPRHEPAVIRSAEAPEAHARQTVSKIRPAVSARVALKPGPLVLPGYIVWSEESSREEKHEFRTDEGGVERIGRLRRTEFHASGETGRLSPEAIIEEYSDKMEEAGAEVLYRDDGRATFRMLTGDLESWIEVVAIEEGYRVTVVDDIPASELSDAEIQVVPGRRPPDIGVVHPAIRPESDLSTADIQALRPPMVTYHVSAEAGDEGDGSEAGPFRTVSRALEHAETLQAMKVRVILHSGVYDESINITRATDIIGCEPVPKIKGTIDGGGRNLRLEKIEVREAIEQGVRQDGGTLEMTGCRIVGTRRSGGDPSSGRGLTLSGGATAVLSGCVFRSNEGQAILLTGTGTRATCSDLQAAYNRVHPDAAQNAADNNDVSGTGCIEVSDGAKFQMEEFDLVGNEYIGLQLRGGSSAHLRYGRIDGTENLDNYGGYNLAVFDGSHIELQHIVTSNGTCGLFIVASWLRVIDIELIGNSIGIACWEPPDGYDLGACLYASEGNIRMENNGINFDSPGAITVPDHTDILGDAGDAEPNCPEVPWE